MRNKVARTAERSLAILIPEQESLGSKIREMLARSGRHLGNHEQERKILVQTLTGIAGVLNQHRIPSAAIKGASLFFLLPEYTDRQLRDLDVVVPDLKALWLATRVLIKQRFVIEDNETPWIQNYALDGHRVEGHITLRDQETGTILDLHSGNITFGLDRMLECDLFGRSSMARLNGAGLLVPSPEDAILVLLAHGHNHGFFTMKDCNDIVEIVHEYGSDLDWSYIEGRIVANALTPYAAYVHKVIQRRYGVSLFRGPRTRTEALLASCLRWSDPVLGEPTPWRLACLQACAAACADWRGLKGRLRAGGIAFTWHLKTGLRSAGSLPLWLDCQLARRERSQFLSNGFPLGRRLFLAPIGDKSSDFASLFYSDDVWRRALGQSIQFLCDGTAVVREGDQELLMTPTGIFVPTVSMLFTEKEWALLESLAVTIVSRVAEASG
jgi:hypothetical protein